MLMLTPEMVAQIFTLWDARALEGAWPEPDAADMTASQRRADYFCKVAAELFPNQSRPTE